MKKSRVFASVCFLILVAASGNIQAYEVFFAEDVAPNFGVNDVPRIETPNSSDAFDNFIARLNSDVYIEDFENFSAQDLNAPLILDFGSAGLATVKDANAIRKESDSSSTYFGAFPSSGHTFLQATSTTAGSSFSIEFDNSEGIAALGFHGTDFEYADIELQFYGANNSLLFTQSLDYSQDYVDGNGLAYAPSGSAVFFGITAVDNPFSKVVFSSSNSPEGFGFDDFVIATADQVLPGTPPVPDPVPVPAPVPEPVPEPGTLLLLGAGLLGLIGLRRRVKK